MEFILRATAIGIGATAILDLWTAFLKHGLGFQLPSLAMLGRWVGHFPRGRLVHADIAKAEAVPGELALGWIAHYGVGLIFAILLLAICGLDWARQPTSAPALIFGIVTVAAPFFVLQPAMDAGIAASKARSQIPLAYAA